MAITRKSGPISERIDAPSLGIRFDDCAEQPADCEHEDRENVPSASKCVRGVHLEGIVEQSSGDENEDREIPLALKCVREVPFEGIVEKSSDDKNEDREDIPHGKANADEDGIPAELARLRQLIRNDTRILVQELGGKGLSLPASPERRSSTKSVTPLCAHRASISLREPVRPIPTGFVAGQEMRNCHSTHLKNRYAKMRWRQKAPPTPATSGGRINDALGDLRVSNFSPSQRTTEEFGEGGTQQAWQVNVSKFVLSQPFEWASVGLTILHAIQLAALVDYQANHVTNTTPTFYVVAGSLLCVMLGVELVLRAIEAYGKFLMRWRWLLFDVFVLLSAIIDVAVTGAQVDQKAVDEIFTALSAIRIVRIVRAVSILRLVRTFRTLRIMVLSVWCSLVSFLWALFMLGMIILIFGIVLTQIATEARVREPNSPEDGEIDNFFGRLYLTSVVLFESVTGGLDWDDAIRPLWRRIGFVVFPIFAMFVSLCVLCVLNMITGLFVQEAVVMAHKNTEIALVKDLLAVCLKMGIDGEGTFKYSQLQKLVVEPTMKDLFQQLDIDLSEAERLFRLIDSDSSGEITAFEFVNGCSRLSGSAKSVDLFCMWQDVGKVMSRVDSLLQVLEVPDADARTLSDRSSTIML